MEEYLVAKVPSSANYLSICLMEEMVLGKLLKKTLVMYRHMIKQNSLQQQQLNLERSNLTELIEWSPSWQSKKSLHSTGESPRQGVCSESVPSILARPSREPAASVQHPFLCSLFNLWLCNCCCKRHIAWPSPVCWSMQIIPSPSPPPSPPPIIIVSPCFIR